VRRITWALAPIVGAFSFGIPPATSAAAPCWKTVIADWSNDGSIDGSYSAQCYRQAMQNAPTDLRIYSSLEEDLQRALAAHSSRRLAGVHPRAATVTPAALDPTGSASSFSFLVALIGGLAGFLAVCSLAAVLIRRRRLR